MATTLSNQPRFPAMQGPASGAHAPRLHSARPSPLGNLNKGKSPLYKASRAIALAAAMAGCVTEFPKRDNPRYEAPGSSDTGAGGSQTPGDVGAVPGASDAGPTEKDTGNDAAPDAAPDAGRPDSTAPETDAGPEMDGATTDVGVPPCIPRAEICNHVDDDCDEQADEGDVCAIGEPCSEGVGPCRAEGVIQEDLTCSVVALPAEQEECNGIDDDCDGTADDNLVPPACDSACGVGVMNCEDGQLACDARQPIAEDQAPLCNGEDDDCNGAADNGLNCNDGQPCSAGIGACLQNGVIANGECNAVEGDPRAETCDGRDNDCDGRIDNGADVACQNECGQGTQECINGDLIACDVRQPSIETCDGVDNNCDGDTDEDHVCELGMACQTGVGTCRQAGTIAADPENGRDVVCQPNAALIMPTAELCDGLDNDCDGENDETFPEQNMDINDNCRFGVCAAGRRVCINGALADSYPEPEIEILGDARDNNCDGSIDENTVCQIQEGWSCVAQSGNNCNPAPAGQFVAVQSCAPVEGEIDSRITTCDCQFGERDRTEECGCPNPPCEENAIVRRP